MEVGLRLKLRYWIYEYDAPDIIFNLIKLLREEDKDLYMVLEQNTKFLRK